VGDLKLEDGPGGPDLPAAAAPERHRRRIIGYLATLVLAAVFGYLAVRHVHFKRAWHALRASDYWWLIPALGVFLLSTWMRAMRWRSLFKHDRRPPHWPVIAATLIGYLFNNIMPARAGEAARVVALRQRAGTPSVEIVGTVIVERAYDLLSILIIFFCAAPWLPHVSWLVPAAIFAGVLALGLGAVIWVLAVHGERPLHFLMGPLAKLPKLSHERVELAVTELAIGLSGLRDRRVALEALAWSLGAWLTSGVWAWLVLLGFYPHLGFAAGVLVAVAIGLSNLLPATPAAVGVFEAAGVLALKAYGISQTGALPYALVLHVSNFVPFLILGGLTLQFSARRPRRLAEAATYT
jgi:uncharacterized protein (TIRG00374 family)